MFGQKEKKKWKFKCRSSETHDGDETKSKTGEAAQGGCVWCVCVWEGEPPCDWLPPPPHGQVLGPLAAAELTHNQTSEEEEEEARPSRSCQSSPRTLPLSETLCIFICSRLRLSDAALTRRSRTPAGLIHRKVASNIHIYFLEEWEIGYREELRPGSLPAEVSHDDLLVENVSLWLFSAERAHWTCSLGLDQAFLTTFKYYIYIYLR